MQGLEGDIDSAHLGFLHNRELGDTRSLVRAATTRRGSRWSRPMPAHVRGAPQR